MTNAEQIAEISAEKDSGMSPSLWAYYFAVELRENNPGMDYATQAAAEAQIMRTFDAHADTLPLRQIPSGLPWPKGEPLPPKWRDGHYMTKAELRAWAEEYARDFLGSALLAEPQAAPAEQPASVAGPGTASPEWQTIAREIADALWNKHKEMGLQGTLDSYADKVKSELRKRKITGPRGEWLSAGTVKREALQGARWWQKRML